MRPLAAIAAGIWLLSLGPTIGRADEWEGLEQKERIACDRGDRAACRALHQFIGEMRENKWAREHHGPRHYAEDLDTRLHDLHAACSSGDSSACTQFRRFVAEHQDQEWAWRLDHPDWFH